MVWCGSVGGGWFQFSLFISFLPIRRQNVPLLSVGAEVVGVEAAGRGVEGEGGKGYEQEGGGGGGGGVGGWKWWNSHIILRRLIAIRRAIGDIFITAVKFRPTRLGNGGVGGTRTIWAIYWHIGTG